MDSFELNKIAGAVLGTLLLTMGLGIVSEILFTPEAPAKPGFDIVVNEGGEGAQQAAEAPKAIPIQELFKTASAEKGASIAKRCAACHNFKEGAGAKVGPDLYGVVGRPVASSPGFSYSTAMKDHGGEWTPLTLNEFITSPKTYIPGTAMSFAGIPKETERADLIAYLNTLSHDPKPLPTEVPGAADAKPAEAAPAADKASAEAKPAEAKPAEAPKPAEAAKPAEAPKPVEPTAPAEAPKPAEEVKPAAPAPAAEAPKAAEPAAPAEAPKPAEEAKPAEAAPAAEPAKPAEETKPAAQ